MKKPFIYWTNVISDNYMVLLADRKLIKEVPFQDLNPLDKVTKIGNSSRGGQATLNRETEFLPYVTYRGIVDVKDLQLTIAPSTEVLVFQMRSEDTPRELLDDSRLLYLVGFMIINKCLAEDSSEFDCELKTMNPATGILRIYKPIFKKFKP